MIAAYIFNEMQAGRIYDFSNGNHYDLDTLSNIGYTSVLADGYDTIWGNTGVSYASSSTFTLPSTQQNLSLCIKLKCAIAPASGNTYVLLQQGTSFSVSINSSGFVVFSLTGNVSGSTTTFTSTGSVNVCDGNYHSIICVANGSVLQIYTDGIAQSTSTPAVYSTITISSSLLIIGSSSTGSTSPYYQGNLSYVIISPNALSANDAANLSSSPQKGLSFQTQANSFLVGDIFSDDSDTVQGVVIWSPDNINVNVLPYTNFIECPLRKIGNIYINIRQYVMKTIDDFDGNGNGQIAIINPIRSTADYNNPSSKQTWDYTGLNGIPGQKFQQAMACLYLTGA